MALISLGCQCIPDCPPIGATRGPPGGIGPIGLTGNTGPQGINNFSPLTATFTVPPPGQNANLQTTDTEWMGVGQTLFIETAGYFSVVQFNSTQIVVVNNPGYPTNATALSVIGVGKNVSGAGPQGPPGQDFILTSPLGVSLGGTGQATALSGFDALSPLAAKGQLLGYDGVHNEALGATVTNGQILMSDATTTLGIRWANQSELVISFNSISPTTTKGDLIVNSGSSNVAFPVGQQGFVLSSDSTATNGIRWVPAAFHTFIHTVVTGSVAVLSGSEDLVGVNRTIQGPTSIVLGPAGAYVNTYVTIKDEFGDADVNNITISTSDGRTIQTNATYVINQPFGNARIYYDGAEFQVL